MYIVTNNFHNTTCTECPLFCDDLEYNFFNGVMYSFSSKAEITCFQMGFFWGIMIKHKQCERWV